MFAGLSGRATRRKMLEGLSENLGLGAPRHEKLISVVYKLPIFNILL